RRVRAGGRADERHPRHRRIPRQSGGGAGKARGGRCAGLSAARANGVSVASGKGGIRPLSLAPSLGKWPRTPIIRTSKPFRGRAMRLVLFLFAGALLFAAASFLAVLSYVHFARQARGAPSAAFDPNRP